MTTTIIVGRIWAPLNLTVEFAIFVKDIPELLTLSAYTCQSFSNRKWPGGNIQENDSKLLYHFICGFTDNPFPLRAIKDNNH